MLWVGVIQVTIAMQVYKTYPWLYSQATLCASLVSPNPTRTNPYKITKSLI